MMKRLTVLLAALAALMLVGSGSAWSGIIVTVGKTGATSSDPRTTNTGGPPSVRTGDEGEDVRTSTTSEMGGIGGPPFVMPAGCRPLGGGLIYCDSERSAMGGKGGSADTGKGAGVGTGEGGGLGEEGFDDDAGLDDESIETLGCASGGAAPGLWAALVGLFGFAFVTRRRRALGA